MWSLADNPYHHYDDDERSLATRCFKRPWLLHTELGRRCAPKLLKGIDWSLHWMPYYYILLGLQIVSICVVANIAADLLLSRKRGKKSWLYPSGKGDGQARVVVILFFCLFRTRNQRRHGNQMQLYTTRIVYFDYYYLSLGDRKVYVLLRFGFQNDFDVAIFCNNLPFWNELILSACWWRK